MKRIFFYILLGLTTLGIAGAATVFGLYVWVSKDLPNVAAISDVHLPQTSIVYARDNSIIGYFSKERRFLVNLDNMAPKLHMAFLAMEDARFYEHQGVDPVAIVRAFVANLRTGRTGQGGSTITQQLIKRMLLKDSSKKYTRKAKEAILAYRLEKHLTKNEILYLYLNEIYLGNSAYGVEAAARTYFGKHAKDLTLAECAVLGGLPQAPSENNPYSQPENTRKRQLLVLGRMLEVGAITQAEHDEAAQQPLEYKRMPDPSWSVGSWYLEEVRRQSIAFFNKENLEQLNIPFGMYGEEAIYEGGLHIHTAMDPIHQKSAEIALRDGLHEACKRRGWRGPLEHLPADQHEEFLKQHPFSPADLENAGWVKALVTKVGKDGAEVRLGAYKGFIAMSTMGWARKPNTNISPEAAGQARDPSKILAPGDVVWVSAIGAFGVTNPVSYPAQVGGRRADVPQYAAADVTPEKAIPLALEQVPDLQGAVASIDVEKGDLVAIAGGYEFSPESQFNRATQAKRQPGSSFKPIVYSTALDNGFTAGSILLDSPFVLPAGGGGKMWKPGNFDGKFLGPILLRTALAKSRNVCTVRVAQQVGMANIVQRAHDLGIPGDIPPVLAVSLGSYEATPQVMAEAYTAFANGGEYIKPRIITSIQNSWGEPLVNFEPDRRQAISPQNAYIMSYLLKEVVNAGTATRATVLRRPVAGKTGTSNDERDAWFIGFSPYLVTSVYVGYDNNTPMGRMETGGRASLPIFIKYRQLVDPLFPPTDFRAPDGISFARIDALTGYIAGAGGGDAYNLPFMTGTTPQLVTGEALQRGDDDVQSGVDLLKQ